MITQIDFKILDAIQKIANPVLDAFFVFITKLGDEGIIWIVLAVVLLFFKKTRKCGIMMALALITGLLVGNLALKNLIARERPYVQNPTMLANLLVEPLSSYSFPSGHTLSSFECATVIYLCNKKWGIGALVLASLIAFSRNYLYVHFFTDVLAGAILGIAIGLFVNYVYKKLQHKIIKKRS